MKRIEALADKVAADKKNPELAAYIRYRALMSAYTLAMQEKGAEFGTIQANWLKSLEKFVTDYPDSADTPDAMLQLAIAQEFAGEDQKARGWYEKIVQKFSAIACRQESHRHPPPPRFRRTGANIQGAGPGGSNGGPVPLSRSRRANPILGHLV